MTNFQHLLYQCVLVVALVITFVKCYPQSVLNNNNINNNNNNNNNNGKVFDKRTGRYVPELHGASLGKWMPDYRGVYQHIKIPYDGGYGDSGLKYEHIEPAVREYVHTYEQNNPKIPFALGPEDHLRFMIDFNYNGTGWQIVKFEWVREGEDERHYNYVNENKLWDTREITNAPQQQQQSIESHRGGDDNVDYAFERRQEPVPEVAAVPVEVQAAEEPPRVDTQQEVSTEAAATLNAAAGEGEVSNVHVFGQYDDSNVYNVTYTEQVKQETANDPYLHSSIREVLDYIVTHIIPTLN